MQEQLAPRIVTVAQKPAGRVHDFRERLAWSEAGGDEPFWAAVYREAFPNFVNCMQTKGDTVAQRLGIDRVIALGNGVNLRIDEKKRKEEWGDILLEYLSSDKTRAPGWMEKDLEIDYLAYAFMSTQRVYLLPWLLLKRAWISNRDNWFDWGAANQHGFSIVSAPNPGYRTWSVAVPIPTLFQALNSAAVVNLKSK